MSMNLGAQNGKVSKPLRERPAAGGITTIADMPLNSNPVTNIAGCSGRKTRGCKREAKCRLCFFTGGVVPGNTPSLEPLIDAGVRGFKCFLIHSGIDDFPNVTEADLNSSHAGFSKAQRRHF